MDLQRIDAAAGAAAGADAAARSAGLEIREIDDLTSLTGTAALFDRIWNNAAEEPLISISTLKAMAHAGSYVSAAFLDGTLVGGLIGFLGIRRGELQLHSHVLGVSPDVQDRSIGFALKLHQRAWSLERGITTVAWTFDPLVRRNAYFNVTKLGAAITAYYDRFYGDMSDGINVGDESDRVLVEWSLEDATVAERSRAHGADPDVDALRAGGAVVALEADGAGEPVPGDGLGSGTMLVQVPDDIVALRARDAGAALRWRRAVRETLGRALDAGYVAGGMSRSGWYVLTSGAGERS
ncbi:MAG: GNAT family N-acetyltransferase [Actinomycetota bacterium]